MVTKSDCGYAQINATLSQLSSDDKAISDFYGFNGQNIISGNITLNNPAFLNKLCDLYPGTLRFPGGTIGMFWDWRTGQFLENDYSSNSCFWSIDRYQNADFTPNTLQVLKSFVDKTGAAPVFDLNTLSSDKYYQLAQLYEAASLNIPIKYVEFGNEFYLDKQCSYSEVYPTGVEYANEMIIWNDLFKGNSGSNGHFPNLETAVVGSKHGTTFDQTKETLREFNWNSEVLPIIGSTPSTIDAVTYHPYFGGGIGTKDIPNKIYNMQNPTRAFLIPHLSLQGDVGAILNQEAGSELNTYDLKSWMTEYNMFDDHNVILGSWAHAMAVNFQSLLLLEKSTSLNNAPNNVTHVNLHTMLGASRWGAIFSSERGLTSEDDSDRFESPDVCSSGASLPLTETLDYTAVGQSMKLLTQASKNATRAIKINFSNLPILSHGNWLPTEGVHGWLFEDSNQPTPVHQAIVLNLTGNPLTINLNSTELSDMNEMETISSVFYYYFTGEDENDCYNPIGYDPPNSYDCSCMYNKSTTTISNTVTLEPYSINRLYKRDLNTCNNIIKLKTNNSNICDGSTVGLQAYLLPLIDDPNNPNWTYNWSSSQPSSLPPNTNAPSVEVAPIYNGSGASTLVTYTVTISGNGCTPAPSATIDIYVHAKPTLNLTSSISPANFVCQGAPITLEAEVNGSSQANFVWINDKAQGITAETITDKSSITVNPEETTEYTVYAVNDNRVCYLSESISASVLSLKPEETICRNTYKLFDITDFIVDAGIDLTDYDINWYVDNQLQTGFTDATTFTYTPPANTSTVNTIKVIIESTNQPNCIVAESIIKTFDCCIVPDVTALAINEIAHGSTLSDFAEKYNSTTTSGNLINLSNNTIVISKGGNNQYDLQTIHVFGTFIIDRNVDFKGINFKMAEGAEIVVLPSANFNATSHGSSNKPSKFEACGNFMWKGIRLMQDAKVIFRENSSSNSTFHVEIHDAEYGIFIENSEAPTFMSSLVSLTKTLLKNNFTSIYIEPKETNAAANSHVSFAMNECTMDGTQLKQVYLTQSTLIGSIAYAGIIANDVSLAINNTTGAENTFINLSNGILANSSNLFLENNKFINITADPAYSNKHNGTAVYASGQDNLGVRPPGFYILEQVGFGSDAGAGDPPSFSNCDYGIVAERMNVESANNYMSVNKAGFRILGSGGRDVHVADNFIQSELDGIQLLQNDNAETLIVENNTIDFGYLHHGSSSNEIPINGIIVMDNGQSSAEPQIINNTISSASINAIRSGITLNRGANYEVGGNDVDLHGTANQQGGIRAFGCNNIAINCNTIDGSAVSLGSAPDLLNRQAGIHVFGAGYSGNVGCNTVDQFHNGILFEGSAVQSGFDINGNNFNTHHYGLHFSSSSFTGIQDRRGNLWNGIPQTMNGFHAVNENTNNYQFSAFLIDGTQPSTLWPANILPSNNWFQPPNPGNTGNFDCNDPDPTTVGEPLYCDDYDPCPWPCDPTEAVDEDIIDGTLQNPPYTDETLYMLQSELYAALNRDSILLNSDSLLQAFYINSQTEAFATFESVNEELLELYQLDETVYNSLQQNNITIETLMSDISTKLEQMQDETLSNAAIVLLQSEVSTLQSQLSNLVSANNNAVELAQTTELLTSANLEVTNNGAPATETIELNEQNVNEVYLNTIAEGRYNFEPTEENTLLSIANQCPLSGGAAVFTARSLYYLIDPNMIYDDRNLCLQQGIILREQQDRMPNTFNVFPNPANNIVNVVYTLNEDNNAKFVLYDNLGRQLFEKNLNNSNTQLQLDVSDIKSGIYFYVINVNKAQESKGKIVIAR